MKTLALITGLLFALSCGTAANAAKVYKWVDKEGVTHYGEQVPQGEEFETISTTTAPPKDAAKAKQRLEDTNAARQSEEAKKLDFEEQKKQREEDIRIRKENCENAKANLKTIQDNARIRMMGDDGQYRYLSEEERQQQLDRAQHIIDTNCGATAP